MAPTISPASSVSRLGQGWNRTRRPSGRSAMASTPADRPSLPQRHRHWAVFKGHGSAVRVVEPPGAAPFGAKFRAVAPQGRRRFIVEGDVTFGVGHVDRHRQHLEQGRPLQLRRLSP